MRVAVASLFRDSQDWHGRPIDQVSRFFAQVDREFAALGWEPEFHLVEGNSRDDTRAALDRACRGRRAAVYTHEVSGVVASTTAPARLANLSALGDTALRPARDGGAALVLWVESDIVVPAGAVAGLADALAEPDWPEALLVAPVPVVAPAGQRLFYDTWAFEGERDEKWANHDLGRLTTYEGRYRPMRAVGTAALMNGHALRAHALDFRGGCFPGLCAAGRAAGLGVYLDLAATVYHPAGELVEGRWV